MSDEMGLSTKAAMQLFAKIQAHNLAHHPTWDQNMAYLKAIRRVEEEAGAGRAVQDDGRTFEQAVWRAIQSYPGTIEIDNVQRFREHLWGRVNASESPPADGGEEAHERGHLLGLGDASESPPVHVCCEGQPRVGDASESPPTERCHPWEPHPECAYSNGPNDSRSFEPWRCYRVRDASESGQPPEASDG